MFSALVPWLSKMWSTRASGSWCGRGRPKARLHASIVLRQLRLGSWPAPCRTAVHEGADPAALLAAAEPADAVPCPRGHPVCATARRPAKSPTTPAPPPTCGTLGSSTRAGVDCCSSLNSRRIGATATVPPGKRSGTNNRCRLLGRGPLPGSRRRLGKLCDVPCREPEYAVPVAASRRAGVGKSAILRSLPESALPPRLAGRRR